jgi:hypothetical protein
MADIIFPGQTPSDTLGTTRLPNNVDMTFWRGDAQTYNIALTDASNNPIDLSGYTAKAAIRASFTAPTKYAWACTIHDTNQVTLYLSSAVSATITAGSYVWDFKLVETATGDTRTYLAGDVTVYDEVDD